MSRYIFKQSLLTVLVALSWFIAGYMLADRQHRKANLDSLEQNVLRMEEFNRQMREARGQ